ncbi:MAG: hypothetical protein JRJ14_10410 [Deltaproteobacteria bacterium]|nr:hypothetical protein [Deltaproteobacteria bacterium]
MKTFIIIWQTIMLTICTIIAMLFADAGIQEFLAMLTLSIISGGIAIKIS